MAKQLKRPSLTHAKVTLVNHPKAPWRVTYDAEQNGTPVRLRKSFASEGRAWTFAQDRETEISNHGVRYGDIPPEVRRAFDYYRDEQAALLVMGADVPRFEDLVSAGLKKIRAKLKQASESDLPLAEVVAEFLAYKATRVKSRQLANLTDQLKRFSQEYGTTPISTITTAQIEKWLSRLRSRRNPDKLAETPFLSPLSRNHYRATLHGLFAYASTPARGLCLLNPIANLDPEHVEGGEPKAYSPDDVAKIMQAALDYHPELLPVLSLGFFAGLRVSEADGFDISKLDSKTDEFRVNSNKTGLRIVPLNDPCKAWLFAQPRRKGRAWLASTESKDDEIAKLFTLAKVEKIKNGARHSFISYRCAETGDVAQVADDVGNSPGTIKKHYRSLVTKADAGKFFAIRPVELRGRILDIKTGRASA